MRGNDGILEAQYGEYPQKLASKRLQDELERAYNYNQSSIKKTGKTYTTDSRKYDAYDEKFSAQIIEEYLFDDGKKYVRVKANSYFDGDKFTLSNGERYKDGDYVWVEVQPIKWIIDEKSDIALSERLLFAGVQFKHERNYKGDFRTTDIKEFMDRYFSKDITSSFSREITPEERQYIKSLLTKSCDTCSNGCCRVEQADKPIYDCVGWENNRIVGEYKVLKLNRKNKER